MDNITKLNLLFDYYGDFLTSRQKFIFEQYYLYDLSLGEIAANSGITRQAVHDILRRSQEILLNFEEKLGMVKRYLNKKKEIQEILSLLREIKPGIANEYKDKYEIICERLASLLKEGGG